MSNAMNEKKMYILKLANSLIANGKVMSGQELAKHLKRNNVLTGYDTEYQGGRGIYTLIRETYRWAANMGLAAEAKKVADAFVSESGEHAW